MSSSARYDAKKKAVLSGSYGELKCILEQSVLEDLANEDEAAFETDYSQLERLYLDNGLVTFAEVEKLCLGLGLMKHLRDDKMSAFHVLLQSLRCLLVKQGISLEEVSSQPSWLCLTFPLKLEREIAAGNLSAALTCAQNSSELPHPSFLYFARSLQQSARQRVCKSIEAAYIKIPVDAAKKLLNIQTDEELENFVASKMSEVWESTLTTNQNDGTTTFGSLATPQHNKHRKHDDTAIVFESNDPPKLWTISPDHKYVEIINTAARRTYVPSSDLMKTWLNLTEHLEAV